VRGKEAGSEGQWDDRVPQYETVYHFPAVEF